MPGAPVRPGRGHGTDHGDRRGTPARGHRGLRAVARRRVPRTENRIDRPRRVFQFLPDEEPGRVRGRGDGRHVRSGRSPSRARAIRTYGWERRDMSVRQGINSRLDELQAALLREKLPFLDDWNQRRYELAMQYKQLLAGLPLTFPTIPPGMLHVFHLFVVRTQWRDDLMTYLAGPGDRHAHPLPRPAAPATGLRIPRVRRGLVPGLRARPEGDPLPAPVPGAHAAGARGSLRRRPRVFHGGSLTAVTGQPDGATPGPAPGAPPRTADGAGNVRRVTSAVFWNFFGKTLLLVVRFAESICWSASSAATSTGCTAR